MSSRSSVNPRLMITITMVSKSKVAKSAIEEATSMNCPKSEPVNSRSLSTGTTTPREVVLKINPRSSGLLAALWGAKNIVEPKAKSNVPRKIPTPSGSGPDHLFCPVLADRLGNKNLRSSSNPERNIKNAKPNSTRKVKMGEGSMRLSPLVPIIMPARISYSTMGIPNRSSRLAKTGITAASPVIRSRAIRPSVSISNFYEFKRFFIFFRANGISSISMSLPYWFPRPGTYDQRHIRIQSFGDRLEIG